MFFKRKVFLNGLSKHLENSANFTAKVFLFLNSFKSTFLSFVDDLKNLRNATENFFENNQKLIVEHFVKGNFSDVRFRIWLLRKFGYTKPEFDFYIGATYYMQRNLHKALPSIEKYLASNDKNFIEEAKYCLAVINKKAQEITAIPLELLRIRFDIIANSYDKEVSNLWQNSLQGWFYLKLKNHILAKKNKFKILDLGCGSGIMGRFFAVQDHIDHLVGIDSSPNMLKLASSYTYKNKPVYHHLNLTTFDEFFSSSDSRFDIICAVFVINYINDINTFVLNASKMLAKGGFIIITYKKYNEPDSKFNFEFEEFTHSEEALVNAINNNKLKIIEANNVKSSSSEVYNFIIATR